ncbi:MAG: NAD-dependent epimerase/dehydratase family protein, partial [Desulfobulbia bacterium]
MKIYLAGHTGMVGSAIFRQLQAQQDKDVELVTRFHDELDLTDQDAIKAFLSNEKPDIVIFAAAKVGGIHANNTFPAEFIYENLMMQCNIIHQAFAAGVE